MRHGFVRVACAAPCGSPGDISGNFEKMMIELDKARAGGAKILVLPQMCLSGSTLGDLSKNRTLCDAALKAALAMARASGDVLCAFGAPLMRFGRPLDCVLVAQGGRLLGVVPIDGRASAAETIRIDGVDVPFGANLLFPCETLPECALAAAAANGGNICESIRSMALSGASIALIQDARPTYASEAERVRRQVLAASEAYGCACVYQNAGGAESSTDFAFGGEGYIVECGKLLAERAPFADGSALAAVTDFGLISAKMARGGEEALLKAHEATGFALSADDADLLGALDKEPYAPSEGETRDMWADELVEISARGLATRLKRVRSRSAVIGVSGGLDSTLALIITRRAFEIASLPLDGILAVTLPAFGTTSRTRSNADRLIAALNLPSREIPIGESVSRHFADIGHASDVYDAAYENAQARERTQVLMDIANMSGGLVVGTGDLSELALGFATYNGDHMSMYGVNGGIYKSAIRIILRRIAVREEGTELAEALNAVLATPISPELLPSKDGDIGQCTEQLVGPYELTDFFLYHMYTQGASASKLLRMAEAAFAGDYSRAELLKWLKIFTRRFFASQFKRSCLPDGAAPTEVSLSPRGGLKMASDASCGAWMNELNSL